MNKSPNVILDLNFDKCTASASAGHDQISYVVSRYAGSWAKRTIDCLIAAVLIVLLAPLLLTVAIWIKFDSPGPVLFRQKRRGHKQRIFGILKFRSMYVTCKPDVFQQATRGDARITRVGRLIRKASIDELPQLFNVLMGHMTLVGPRPHPLALDDMYLNVLPYYRRRFDVLPGLTGLAQISGARGETPTTEHMDRRVRYDLQYVGSASLIGDLSILFATTREVVTSSKAF